MNDCPTISVIIPVYNAAATLRQCLNAVFASDYSHFEVIVVDDASDDDSPGILKQFPCKMVRLPENRGAAHARNRGAEVAAGEILLFTDADMTIEGDTIRLVAESFRDQPEVSAIFGSYRKTTGPTNFFSIYKNLVHHYTHQKSREDAATFWTGLGGMRTEVFRANGGFDEAYRSLEDMELGYRLFQSGHRTGLLKHIQATHCKRYSFVGVIKSDVLNRAIPWTKIMLSKRIARSDLNTKIHNVASVPVAFLLLLGIPVLWLWPMSRYCFVALGGLFLILNHDFYRFVLREKGVVFLVKAIGMNWLGYLYSGIGLVIGVASYLRHPSRASGGLSSPARSHGDAVGVEDPR
jgi:glycosyltransferase involved in cell wall biosynthesis